MKILLNGQAGGVCQKSGFTLIELMVVISIVSLMVAVMLPVLGNARESARGTQCASNLRQMMIATINYTVDHDDWIFPSAATTVETGTYRFWPFKLILGGYFPSETRDENNQFRVMPQVYYCPSIKPNHWQEQTDWTQVYGYRSWKSRHEPLAANAFLRYQRFGEEIDRPSDHFLYGDSIHANLGTPYYVIGQGNNAVNHRVHLRHGIKSHLAFADGHVSQEDQDYLDSLKISGHQHATISYLAWPE